MYFIPADSKFYSFTKKQVYKTWTKNGGFGAGLGSSLNHNKFCLAAMNHTLANGIACNGPGILSVLASLMGKDKMINRYPEFATLG